MLFLKDNIYYIISDFPVKMREKLTFKIVSIAMSTRWKIVLDVDHLKILDLVLQADNFRIK